MNWMSVLVVVIVVNVGGVRGDTKVDIGDESTSRGDIENLGASTNG